jgi:hypothetical protein
MSGGEGRVVERRRMSEEMAVSGGMGRLEW